MRRAGALLVWRAFADHSFACDQARAVISHRFVNRALDISEVMAVALYNMPTGCGVSRLDVFTGRKISAAIDRDVVIVPQHNHPAQLQMACNPDRFMVDALHQATIARNHPGAVVDQIIAENGIEMSFGHGHADRHRQSLAQRTSRAFDTIKQEVLRVPCAWTSQLTEISNIIHRWGRISRQMQQAVDQH